MTENKRFTIDNFGFIFDGEELVEDIVDTLNDLNDENEQLYELIDFANTLIAFKTSESCQKEWAKRLKGLKGE